MEKMKSGFMSFLQEKKGSSEPSENISKKGYKTDHYDKYRLSFREKICCAAVWAAMSLLLGRLFFHSFIAALPVFCALPLIQKYYAGSKKEKRLDSFSVQFCDAMSAYAAAISSGYSAENAVNEAIKETERAYGRESDMVIELMIIKRRLTVGETIEIALSELSERSGSEEIMEMAEVFSQAKRSGGSLPKILRHTVQALERKQRLKEEIKTIITAKRLEHRIMCIMPLVILLYVNLAGAEFIAPLYDGLRGKVIMGAALGIYLFAVALGEKLVRIRV